MNTPSWQTLPFFPLHEVITPPLVHIFTLLRHSDIILNDLRYPEITCEASLCDVHTAGETASKLTAALSIHLDGFLSLSCSDANIKNHKVTFIARFSNSMHPQDVSTEIEQKAADIIDTLMALA
jgi:hypothetical protein